MTRQDDLHKFKIAWSALITNITKELKLVEFLNWLNSKLERNI